MKKCKAHHYILEEPSPGRKIIMGVCKICGNEKPHSNTNERIVTKRVVKKGRKAQDVVGIRLKGHKSHFANGFEK